MMGLKLSASRVNTFEMCPLQYFNKYVKKVYVSEKYERMLGIGSLVHKAIELLSEYPVRENISKCVLRAVKEVGKQAVLAPDMVEEAEDMIKNWFSPSKFENETIAVEQQFNFNISGVSLFGYIDKAEKINDNTVKVIDYKTGYKYYTESELKDSNQLLIYAMAAFHKWNPENVIICYDMVKHDRRVEIQVDESDIRDKFQYLQTIYETIFGDFEPKAITGSHCVWCPYKGVCRDYSNYLLSELGLKDSNEVINADIDETLAYVRDIDDKVKTLDAHSKELKKWIMNEMQNAGKEKLQTDKFDLSVVTTRRVSYSPKTVLEAFPDKINKLFSVKKQEFDKIFKELKPEEKAKLMKDAIPSEGSPYLKIKKR